MTRVLPVTRHVAGGLGLSALALLVTACGSAAKPATTTTPVTSASRSAPAAPASSAAATAPAASPAVPGGPAQCPTRDLQAKRGLSQGTAGSVYQVIDFTNIGTVACTLYGYPGVALAGGTPVKEIGLAASRNSSTPRKLITLAPGAVANALLQIVDAGNYPSSECQPVTTAYLQIIPPDQTTPIYLSYTSRGCTKPVQLLSISAMAAGSGGST